MPVIARLSRQFYDRLGEEIANELVELLNQVDSTSRADLRELNELNFARFDAKLEQRIAETNARIDTGLAKLDAKIDRVAAELNAKIDTAVANMQAALATFQASVHKDMKEQTRWFYLAWATQMAAIIGLWTR